VLVVVIVEAVSTSETFQSVYLRLHGLFIPEGRAMAQAVSRRPLTTEAQVRACVNPCGIYGGQSGTRQVFLRVLRFSPVNIISPRLSTLVYHVGD
jgi:hypothetical protein